MFVSLMPGESLTIDFRDESARPIDGEFEITFNQDYLSVRTDWEDSTGRVGEIYMSRFGSERPEDVDDLADEDHSESSEDAVPDNLADEALVKLYDCMPADRSKRHAFEQEVYEAVEKLADAYKALLAKTAGEGNENV